MEFPGISRIFIEFSVEFQEISWNPMKIPEFPKFPEISPELFMGFSGILGEFPENQDPLVPPK